MKLADYQQILIQHLLEQSNEHDALQSVFTDQSKLEQRLAIYQANIIGSRFAALQQIFPCVERLLGVDYFRQLAEPFLQQHASEHVAIDHMWPTFVNFIEQHSVLEHVNYIADVAQFEGCWHQVFHGRDNARKPVKAVSIEDTFYLPNDVQFFTSVFPVQLLWEMCQPEYQGDFQLPESSEQHFLMLLQCEQAIEITVLTAMNWQVLTQLATPMRLPVLNSRLESAVSLDMLQLLCQQGLLYSSEFKQ